MRQPVDWEKTGQVVGFLREGENGRSAGRFLDRWKSLFSDVGRDTEGPGFRNRSGTEG